MKRLCSLPTVLVLTALLALSAGLVTAQGPAPQGSGPLQTMLGTTFTYQGQLQKDDTLVDATCTMAFALYDDGAAGNLVGTPITTSVTVAGGLFTVALDFGGSVFFGEARWLEVAVQCPGDAGFNTLSPRQALTAAPYALSLQPGARIIGDAQAVGLTVSNTDPNGVFGVYGEVHSNLSDAAVYGVSTADDGQSYGVRGTGYSGLGGGVSGYANATSGETHGVYGWAGSTAGTGVEGRAGASSGTTYGVYGQAESTEGTGVYGYATATGGEAFGVYGRSDSPAGAGVLGYAIASSGETYGVYGRSNSPDGMGVFGRNAATSGYAYAVYGRSDSTGGRGVLGYATATSGTTHGVAGRSDSPAGAGVYGYAGAASGDTTGVYGEADSTDGAGVYGRANATTGTADGVYGETHSSDGRGIVGWATATGGGTRGVYGRSNSSEGYGVYGNASAGSGYTAGVYGTAASADGTGVTGSSAGGTGVYGYSTTGAAVSGYSDGSGVAVRAEGQVGGNLIEAWHGPIDLDRKFYVADNGNVYADGSYLNGARGHAEMLPGAPGLEAGDVLIVGPDGKLARCDAAFQPTVVGVYAPQAGFIGGAVEGATDQVALAVVGVVTVKVSAENGPIAPGDLLVASATAGHAMRAGDNPALGTVIGKALGSLDKDSGTILMLVMLR